jgi:hypothetical protein
MNLTSSPAPHETFPYLRAFMEGRQLDSYSLPFFLQVVTDTGRVVPVCAISYKALPGTSTKYLRLVVPGEDGSQVELSAAEISTKQFKIVADALATMLATSPRITSTSAK